MALAPLLLVLLASLVHATWNLLAKRAAAAGVGFVFAYNLFACAAYAPWVLWLLTHGRLTWSRDVAAFVLLSALLHLGYSLSLQRGYRIADLSVVYPVARGTGPIFSTLGAVLLLGERPSAHGLAGLALVAGGIGLVATGGRWAALHLPGGQAGLRWGALTGGFIAAYTVADAWTVGGLRLAPVALDWCSNLIRFVLLAPVVARAPKEAWAAMRGRWRIAAAVGLLSPLAYILVLEALRLGAPLTLVAPLREMSMMIGALFGMAVLRERVGPGRLLGCALMAAGVVLLAT